MAELGLVFYLSARVETLAPTTAMTLFIVYSALNGVTLSFILLVYTGESIASTFLVTSGMFGALALFGSTTKRSLAGVGQFLFMGLIGLVLASIVGMFWHNDTLQFLISTIGVIVFTGLTAWDAQRLETDGGDGARGPHGLLRRRRRPRPLPQFHQPLSDAPPLTGRPSRLNPDRLEDALVDLAASSLSCILQRLPGCLGCIPVKHSRHREDHISSGSNRRCSDERVCQSSACSHGDDGFHGRPWKSSVATGVRTTAAVLVPLVIGQLAGDTALAMMVGIGGLNVSLADIGGPTG